MRPETAPYTETVDPQGDLNWNSWSATAACGLVELAVETLHRADRPVTCGRNGTVTALAATFAAVTANAQRRLGGQVTMQTGMHTRLRGALRTCLTVDPFPFDGTPGDGDRWAEDTTRRLTTILSCAESLWAEPRDPDSRPWASLTGPELDEPLFHLFDDETAA